MNKIGEISEDERLVLKEIRARKFQNINIQINNGKVILIRREETIKPKPNRNSGSH